MANYYCLMAGLPDIELSDTHPGYTFEQLKEQCDESLTKEDKKLLFFFFLKCYFYICFFSCKKFYCTS